MSDRIVLAGMVFEGRHGYTEAERGANQPFEVDVELALDLASAGTDDDLGLTVDYAAVYEVVGQIVESASFRLVEALAEAIAQEVLAGFARADEVLVRVRKPRVRLPGPLASAGVEIRRSRPGHLPK